MDLGGGWTLFNPVHPPLPFIKPFKALDLAFKATWDPGLADPHCRGHCSDRLLAPGLVCRPWGWGRHPSWLCLLPPASLPTPSGEF